MCVSPDDGGYAGFWEHGLSRLLKLEWFGFPFQKVQKNMNIKVEEATDLILREKPKAVIIFGASKFLFPHPLRTLAKAAYDVGTHGGYDGSARAAFQWRALSLVHPIPSGSPQFGGYKEDGVIARKLEKANIIIH